MPNPVKKIIAKTILQKHFPIVNSSCRVGMRAWKEIVSIVSTREMMWWQKQAFRLVCACPLAGSCPMQVTVFRRGRLARNAWGVPAVLVFVGLPRAEPWNNTKSKCRATFGIYIAHSANSCLRNYQKLGTLAPVVALVVQGKGMCLINAPEAENRFLSCREIAVWESYRQATLRDLVVERGLLWVSGHGWLQQGWGN